MQAKNPFGDCGGNITDSENGYIKSPNFPEKYTTNDQSKSPMKKNLVIFQRERGYQRSFWNVIHPLVWISLTMQ